MQSVTARLWERDFNIVLDVVGSVGIVVET